MYCYGKFPVLRHSTVDHDEECCEPTEEIVQIIPVHFLQNPEFDSLDSDDVIFVCPALPTFHLLAYDLAYQNEEFERRTGAIGANIPGGGGGGGPPLNPPGGGGGGGGGGPDPGGGGGGGGPPRTGGSPPGGGGGGGPPVIGGSPPGGGGGGGPPVIGGKLGGGGPPVIGGSEEEPEDADGADNVILTENDNTSMYFDKPSLAASLRNLILACHIVSSVHICSSLVFLSTPLMSILSIRSTLIVSFVSRDSKN
ncbi:hypothetical protein GCK72_009932 [Caenorhabditis remanei]|uniref:Uncharacterized protein n=1 Tax=Caenorhabditis remanei TaxID=31234 RepID=A0A6A5H490_CAERE|nr:hypothetical protein GCK72_009932 [Caenorhabditis remanei]KAF1761676.1 hypothetical protein GCK72_009932 [Caenorhabditis remanei]